MLLGPFDLSSTLGFASSPFSFNFILWYGQYIHGSHGGVFASEKLEQNAPSKATGIQGETEARVLLGSRVISIQGAPEAPGPLRRSKAPLTARQPPAASSGLTGWEPVQL